MSSKSGLMPSTSAYTSRSTPRRWPSSIGVCICALLLAIYFLQSLPDRCEWKTKVGATYPSHTQDHSDSIYQASWTFDVAQDGRNYGLSDERCDAAFSDLFTEIDRARDFYIKHRVNQSLIGIRDDDVPYRHTQAHAMLFNGRLYVIADQQGAARKSRAKFALAALHRAITAIPDPAALPNVEFTMDVQDTPTVYASDNRVVWASNRKLCPFPLLATVQRLWHRLSRAQDRQLHLDHADFAGWADPDPAMGSYESFLARLPLHEQPFAQRIPASIWRGAVSLPNGQPRKDLLDIAHRTDESWLDAKAVNWQKRENVMEMASFCTCQFPINTEGEGWSGRLRYLLNCASTTVFHAHETVAHFPPLLKAEGEGQKYIPTGRDFSDLVETLNFYRKNPEAGERVAQNASATFRDRYLTPAAEAYYWRRMVRNWAEVQAWQPSLYKMERTDDGGTRRLEKGVSWGLYALVRGQSN